MRERNISAGQLMWRLFVRLALLIIILGVAVRGVMIAVTGPSELGLTFGQYCGSFLIGALNDLSFATLSMVFLWLYLISVGEAKYRWRTGWIILGSLALATVVITWFCPALQEFNRGLAKVLRWVMLYWTLSFALRFMHRDIRLPWTRAWLWVMLFIYVTVMYLNAVGEFFFWDEFAVRYNFIAVDYLVYTSEVIGNILESYPIVPLSILTVAVSGLTTWLLFRRPLRAVESLYQKKAWRLKSSIIYLLGALASAWFLNFSARFQQADNMYYNELQANGPTRFFEAFMKNRLDYDRFYPTLPEAEATALVNAIYGSHGHNERAIAADSVVRTPNIVLVTMESMSADFLARFGNDRNLTPTLDTLYNKSIAFDRMFANGNRTVRGLEALSLAIPPSAGQSLIKRPDLKMRPSIGSVLRDKGYRTMFFYGGKSYFDNMGPFFRSIGFDVIDKDNYSSEEITFSNIWGVCDGDSYSKTLKEIDAAAATGKPFYAQIMTISNHRPYTYPDGCIDISPESKSRDGGVKYSDYALGQFIAQASKKPWFDNTVFVIVADHCASSAGETELPLEKYHIPALIYAPALFAPQTIDYAVSQIDLMPTLLSLLGMGYDSTFYGRNVLDSDYSPRAFMATYQDLGYLEGDTLTVLSPVDRIRQYVVSPTADNTFNLIKTEADRGSRAARNATALYQTSAHWND